MQARDESSGEVYLLCLFIRFSKEHGAYLPREFLPTLKMRPPSIKITPMNFDQYPPAFVEEIGEDCFVTSRDCYIIKLFDGDIDFKKYFGKGVDKVYSCLF
jgi:hypothetical protein